MAQQDIWGKQNRVAGWDYHEENHFHLSDDSIQEIPSLLNDLFPPLSEVILDYQSKNPDEQYNITYDITLKIEHNLIVKYKEILEEYGNYMSPVQLFLDTLDTNSPWNRLLFLKHINGMYRDLIFDEKEEDEEKIDFIKRKKWDYVIDKIRDLIYNDYINSPLKSKTHTKEQIQLAIVVVLCKSFVDCKILENPNL